MPTAPACWPIISCTARRPMGHPYRVMKQVSLARSSCTALRLRRGTCDVAAPGRHRPFLLPLPMTRSIPSSRSKFSASRPTNSETRINVSKARTMVPSRMLTQVRLSGAARSASSCASVNVGMMVLGTLGISKPDVMSSVMYASRCWQSVLTTWA